MDIRIEIGIDCNDPVGLADFWSKALGYRVGDMDRAGTYLDIVAPGPGLPVIYFQRVPEPKRVKNRLHLDIYTRRPEATVAELVGLGATTVGDVQSGSEGGWWQVMADPEGNEFCICRQD